MKEFYKKLYDRLTLGEHFVLVSVVSSSGSTPRGGGARMAVFKDGSIAGTIGGGAVEYLSIQKALEAMKEKSSCIQGFDLNKNQVADIGMICGGAVEVCFQYMDADQEAYRSLFADIVALEDENVDAWLITQIEDGVAGAMGLYDTHYGLRYFPEVVLKEIKPYLTSKAILTSDRDPVYFIEPLQRAGYTYVFGGGHVAQELVPVIAHLGFKTVVYEDRESFADPAKFPGVYKTILGSYTEIGAHLSLTPKDFVVIMTRGHQSDYEVLEQILPMPAAYIGIIGSRKKMALTKERLLLNGFSEADFSRLYTPIGLPIGAQTPAEIAISVAAQMILCRAKLWEEG